MRSSKAMNNAKWMVICKMLQALIQLVVGMLSARFLGPSNYGLIHYATSVTGFFVPLMRLGLNETLVNEYIDHPEEEGKILGTSLMMNLLSAAASIAGVVSFAAVANKNDTVTILVCGLYATSLLFQAVEMMQYWFQAKLLSKFASVFILVAYTAGSVYRIVLLILEKSVYWFALLHSLEYAIAGVLMLIAYHRLGKGRLSFSWDMAKKMFAKSRYYILAAMVSTICRSIGSVVLNATWGEEANGYLATATTCTCILAFVFYAILDTCRPVILESKKESQEAFEKNVSKLYSFTIYFSLAEGLGLALFAQLVVKILYGEAYLPAVTVLQILAWNIVFSYCGNVRNVWILGEGKHTDLWKINTAGAVVSVMLNGVFVPQWGACGAALAAVLTQFFTNVIMGFVIKSMRPNNRLLLKGLDPRLLIETVSLLRRKDTANNT